MTRIGKIPTIILLLTASVTAHAEDGVNSPYSRYGYGLLADRSMGFNKAMGGIAQGFRNGKEINMANPASYSAVDSLTALFDLGFTMQNGNFKLDGTSQNIRNSSFDYIAFQFRALKGLGVTVGLLPFSRANYSFSSSENSVDGNNSITSTYKYTGKGNLRQIVLGLGYNIIKPLSVGVNIGYLWGEYDHNMANTFSGVNAFSNSRNYTADLSAFTYEFGLQYDWKINNNNSLTLGATYSPAHKMNGDAMRKTSTMSSSAVEASSTVSIDRPFSLPHSISFGVGYTLSNKLRAGVDFEYQKWSKATFPSADDYERNTASKGVLNDRYKIAAGLEYIPNPYSNSILKYTSYKLGGYYSQSYANASETGLSVGTKPKEYGLSFGFTLPISNSNLYRSFPKINVTFAWVHSQIQYYNNRTVANFTPQVKTLKEDYLKLSLGVSINERWFTKWKVQ